MQSSNVICSPVTHMKNMKVWCGFVTFLFSIFLFHTVSRATSIQSLNTIPGPINNVDDESISSFQTGVSELLTKFSIKMD